jgi:hypothetical protein
MLNIFKKQKTLNQIHIQVNKSISDIDTFVKHKTADIAMNKAYISRLEEANKAIQTEIDISTATKNRITTL